MDEERNEEDRGDLLGRGIRMDPLLPPMTSASDAPRSPEVTEQRVPESALRGESDTPPVRPGGQGLSAAEVAQLTEAAQHDGGRALDGAENPRES